MLSASFHPAAEIAAVAARLVVDEGLDYACAKRQAARQLGLSGRAHMPDNTQLEAAIREHIAVFCPQEQAQALRALRELALSWMERLSGFRPHLSGPVWHGTATAHTDVVLHLFCDDPKSAEWELLDRGLAYQAGQAPGVRGEVMEALTLRVRCEALQSWVMLHLVLHDRDDLRGALRPDAQGRRPRGDAAALRALLEASGGEHGP
ncbi:MAG: hypothetical protein EP306_01855 [Burkholderiales bacterium]|nr:MAG: hypothetical protein EP306_01855 [Burkholderiales bacterium]